LFEKLASARMELQIRRQQGELRKRLTIW